MKLCSSSLRRSNVSFLHLVLFKYSAFSQEHKVHLCKYYNIWMSRLFCVERFMTWCYELSLQMKVIHVSQSTAGFFGGRHQPDPGIKHRTSRLCSSLIIIWFWNSLILWVLLYLNTNNYFVFCSFVQPWTRWKFWVFDLWSIPGAAQLTVGLSAENPQIRRKPLELSVNQPGPALCLQADRQTRWALDKQGLCSQPTFLRGSCSASSEALALKETFVIPWAPPHGGREWDVPQCTEPAVGLSRLVWTGCHRSAAFRCSSWT